MSGIQLNDEPFKEMGYINSKDRVNPNSKDTDPGFVPPPYNRSCGLLAVSAEGGQNNLPVLHSLEQYALACGLRVVHSPNWPFVGVCGKGNDEGDDLQDDQAMENARELGRLVARALAGSEENTS
jgi:hypothetical protein